MCPSRELSAQTHQFVKKLSAQCSDIVSLYELGQEGDDVTDSIGAAIVCGTPGRFVKEIGGYCFFHKININIIKLQNRDVFDELLNLIFKPAVTLAMKGLPSGSYNKSNRKRFYPIKSSKIKRQSNSTAWT